MMRITLSRATTGLTRILTQPEMALTHTLGSTTITTNIMEAATMATTMTSTVTTIAAIMTTTLKSTSTITNYFEAATERTKTLMCGQPISMFLETSSSPSGC